ncbi:ATP/maltotriose-dependent transcriptional regulator MalT [Algoriphagus boseongensis]|uniref:ATP/maltotriose-dependent transcriptional regulator MalT n=1 Tax=Algoriphagus boseongensis TaxID=1442587 RepID=A0A4V3D2I2_9BACT|nr:LuxR C-terminal-related transcriptional regulator [Algoriphagus boseongensis]TDQ19037.1 ATP/maltotriose-dependent transcriptional regulator MalT [Algoriphagus boseongensis]
MLSTKLNSPTLSKDLLHRTDLVEKLEENSLMPLILISAPAGYGKSVLVSQWLNYYQKDFSWLSLDESMNSTSVFITYLIDILEKIEGSKKIQNIFKNKQELHFLSWDALINRIINSVNQLQKNFRLVLDDYHLIKNPEIHQLVKALINENLSNLQLVIITRWDPPFQLRALRLYNKMLELRMRDLRFEKSEIHQLLSTADDIRIKDSEINSLLENTEGWILAIRMFLLVKSFSDPFYENNENEILANDLDRLMFHISENIDPNFFRLMQLCALFDQFDKELISAICRIAFPDSCSAETFLSKLVELNFFLIPIRDSHGKFRFHHLIGDILKRQLIKSEPALANTLYNEISEWYSDNGLVDDAMNYSIKANNYTLACNLIKTHRGVFLEKGQWWILQRWIKSIPRQIRNTHIDLLLTELLICEETWNLDDFSSILNLLESIGIENSDPENVSRYLFHLGYYLTYVSPDPKKAEECLERSKALYQDESGLFGARRELILATSRQMLGNSDVSLRVLENIQKEFDHSSIMHTRAIHGKVIVHLLSGNFESAINQVKKLHFLVQDTDFNFSEGWCQYFFGNFAFQSYLQDECERAFKQILDLEGRLHFRVYFDALSGLALFSSLKRNMEATNSFLEQMSQLASNLNNPKFQDYSDSIRARVLWHNGKGEKKLDWALNDWAKVQTGNYLFLIDVPELTKLRIIVTHGSIQLVKEAMEVLKTLESSLNEIYNNYHTVDISLLKAIAEYRLGNFVSAEKSLEKALLYADRDQISRPIVEVYQVLPELFNLIRSSSDSFHTLARLGLSKSTAVRNPEKLIFQELTIREQEIVKLISDGLRNKEIADQLNISIVTVKSHLTNIFKKLNVTSRTSMLSTIRNM